MLYTIEHILIWNPRLKRDKNMLSTSGPSFNQALSIKSHSCFRRAIWVEVICDTQSLLTAWLRPRGLEWRSWFVRRHRGQTPPQPPPTWHSPSRAAGVPGLLFIRGILGILGMRAALVPSLILIAAVVATDAVFYGELEEHWAFYKSSCNFY